jgi:hypothetical protein
MIAKIYFNINKYNFSLKKMRKYAKLLTKLEKTNIINKN